MSSVSTEKNFQMAFELMVLVQLLLFFLSWKGVGYTVNINSLPTEQIQDFGSSDNFHLIRNQHESEVRRNSETLVNQDTVM